MEIIRVTPRGEVEVKNGEYGTIKFKFSEVRLYIESVHQYQEPPRVYVRSSDVLFPSPNWSNHPGNVQFLSIIQALKPIYKSKHADKRGIVDKFVSDWHTAGSIHATGGRLLDQVNGQWKQLNVDDTKERCVQLLSA